MKAAIPVRLDEVSLFTVCFRVRSTWYADKFVRQIENRPHARRWRTGDRNHLFESVHEQVHGVNPACPVKCIPEAKFFT